MGHFTQAEFDGRHRKCGSRAQEDTPSAPSLQTRSSLTTNATQACSSHPAVCFLVHLWFFGFYLINTRVSTNLPLCWLPRWCNRQSRPEVTFTFFSPVSPAGTRLHRTFDIQRSEPDSATTGGNVSCSPRLTSCHRKQEQTSTWYDWAGESVQSATLHVRLHHSHV